MRPLVPVLIEQNWRNFWSTSFDDIRASQCSTLQMLLVAYELSITELKIQRIVRVLQGLASPLANLSNKSVPEVSWEIASKAPAHSKKEIRLAIMNSSSSSMPFFYSGTMYLRTLLHAKRYGFRGKLTAARPLVGSPDTQEAAAQSTRRSLALHRHLLREEDYAQATDGCGRSKPKVVCLEDQIHIGAKLNALSFGHREQAVAVHNVVECFSPFGINVTIANAQLCVPAGSMITLWALAVSTPSNYSVAS